MNALLVGNNECYGALTTSPLDDILVETLHPILQDQSDIVGRITSVRIRYMKNYWVPFGRKRCFPRSSCILPHSGHTQMDIDAMFGCWSQDLPVARHLTLPSLMKFHYISHILSLIALYNSSACT